MPTQDWKERAGTWRGFSFLKIIIPKIIIFG
jgi:hypothetical protein